MCEKKVPVLNFMTKTNILAVDLGYGVLKLTINNSQVKYRFEPSKKLEEVVISTVLMEKNSFVSKIESNLVQRLTEVYKELL